MKTKILFLGLLIQLFSIANGQTLESYPATSSLQVPSNFIEYNSKMYYFARNTNFEFGLYATDGTTSDNQVIKNLGFAFSTNLNDENNFNDYKIIFNNKLYFNFSNALYQSDGTTAGTNVFIPSLVNARYFKIYNNRLYFIAVSGNYGAELWSTDGTVAGTSLVKDINPGNASAFNYVVYDPHFTVFNNKLFFVANDAIHGYELWSTDGSEAGTNLFKDIRPTDGNDIYGSGGFLGTIYYNQPNFKVVGNKMYFGANPYQTNGAVPNYMISDSPVLYETDGTPDGTFFVQPPLGPNYDYNYLYNLKGLTAIDNKLFVFCQQAYHDFPGITNGGVYLIDGTNPITRLQGFASNAGDVGTSDGVERFSMRRFNGEYYFLGETYDNADAVNLWKMNPTDYSFTKITQATSTTNPDFSDSNINLNLLIAKEINNKLFFVKTDLSASQIFSTDGTASGTQFEAKNSNQSSASNIQSTQAMTVIPKTLFRFSNALYFSAQFALGQPTSLWRLNFESLSNENFVKNEFKIFPNPTATQLMLKSSFNLENASLKIISLTGQTVLEQQNLSGLDFSFDVSDLNASIYLLEVNEAIGKHVLKFIKQ